MKNLIILMLLVVLGACSNMPSITNSKYVREIPDGYQAVSVCHNGDVAEKLEIEQLALAQCPAGTMNLQPWDFDWFINACPLMKPRRITFLCTQ